MNHRFWKNISLILKKVSSNFEKVHQFLKKVHRLEKWFIDLGKNSSILKET